MSPVRIDRESYIWTLGAADSRLWDTARASGWHTQGNQNRWVYTSVADIERKTAVIKTNGYRDTISAATLLRSPISLSYQTYIAGYRCLQTSQHSSSPMCCNTRMRDHRHDTQPLGERECHSSIDISLHRFHQKSFPSWPSLVRNDLDLSLWQYQSRMGWLSASWCCWLWRMLHSKQIKPLTLSTNFDADEL